MSLVEVKDLVYIYGQNTPFCKTALDHVFLTLEKGGIKAIIGHTGSGKSTLIQHLNALLTPNSGTVCFEGQNVNESKEVSYQIRFRVGLCFQYPEYQLFENTVYQDIAFGPKNMGLNEQQIDAAVQKAASYVGITPDLFQQSPFDLSGGQKRRIAMAGVMAMDPDLLILDEPTAGLDPRGRNQILSFIRDYKERSGKTVLIVSHSMDDVAECADEVIVVNDGKIAMQGSVREVFSRSEELSKMGLTVPETTRIIERLRAEGYDLPAGIFTVEQAAQAIYHFLKGGGAD